MDSNYPIMKMINVYSINLLYFMIAYIRGAKGWYANTMVP